MEDAAVKCIIEALLFVSGDPLSADMIEKVVEEAEPSQVSRLLHDLQSDYSNGGRGLHIVEVAGGYQITTRPEYAPWMKRLLANRPPRLSQAALETLAVVAYQQPVTRSDIEAIRGVDSSGVLHTLFQRKLVRIMGRRHTVGRPLTYGTTREFLQHFGLKDLSELPTLKEFQELEETPSEQTREEKSRVV